MSFDLASIRAQFPALQQQAYGRPLVYLDNAATAQKPLAVLKMTAEMEGGLNGNVHRAAHYLSTQATARYEAAREALAQYIGAASVQEIIFTSGATAAINLVAFSFGENFVKAGDAILVSEAEHHSNIVPWQLLCERKGATLRVLPVDEDGHWRMDLLPTLIDEKLRLVTVSHIGNVLGQRNPVEALIQQAHSRGVPVLIDGAQGVVHGSVNVQTLDCDFYVFSGHKLYGPTGTGILYGKTSWLEQMPPWQGGGDMIASVSFAKTSYAELPLKFEAGTPNFIGQAGLGAAVQYLEGLDFKALAAHEQALTQKGLEVLLGIDGLRLYGSHKAEEKIPLFSFSVQGAHASDLALLLDKMGYAVRSGQLCAEPLLVRYGETSLLRMSAALYNTIEELENFGQALQKAVNMLR